MPAKIDREDLLQELRDLADKLDRAPKKKDVEQMASYSYDTYYRRFGGIGKACTEAGIEPNMPGRSASDEDVLEELRRLNNEVGRPPTQSDIKEYGKYSNIVYKNRFGSIPDAREAAGLPYSPYRPGRHATDEELLEELQRVANELDRRPSVDDINEHSRFTCRVYRDRFGSVPEARSEAGLGDGDLQWRAGPEKVEKSELIEELQRISSEIGRAPTFTELKEHSGYSSTAYYNRFGSLSDAREVAGLEDPGRPNQGYQADELINRLQELSDDLGRPPTVEDINEHSDLSKGPYQRVFGSIPDAREAAGLDRNPYVPGNDVTNEELLADLRNIADKLGHPPTKEQLEEHIEYNVELFRRRFGGLRNAREQAGLRRAPHVPGADADRSDLIEEIERLHDEIGRPPTSDDIQGYSIYSEDVFYSQFDSIHDAREAAGLPRHLSITDIERIGFDLLDRLDVEYERFYQIGKYEADALLPNHNIVIEFDGGYWHGHPSYDSLDKKQESIKERDRRKDTYLSQEGYTVVRVWGPDLRDSPEQVANVLEKIINGERGHLHGKHIPV